MQQRRLLEMVRRGAEVATPEIELAEGAMRLVFVIEIAHSTRFLFAPHSQTR